MITRLIKTLGRHSVYAGKLLCAGALLGSVLPASAQLKKVGTGTTSNTSTTYPTPFGNRNAGQKAIYIYRASELVAAGFKPGWISSLSFLVTNTNSSVGHSDLRFYVDSWSGALPTNVPTFTGMTLRWTDKLISYLPVLGYNTFNFSAPYYWNGLDDIAVGTCFWTGSDLFNASVEMTTGLSAGVSRTFVGAATTSLGSGICNGPRAASSADVPSSRPNAYFYMNSDTCKSKPTAGIAKSSTSQFCIFDDSLEVSLSGNSLAYGLSFQWQSATSASGPWTNMGSSSTSVINRKAVQTVSTYYRCIVTCTGAGSSDTSKPVYVPMAPPYNCDCASEATTTGKEKILSVKLGTMLNPTPCGPSMPGYLDFTTGVRAIPATDLEPGTSYTLETKLSSCDGSNSARAVKVFIDFDQSATYEISEMVYANTYSALQPNPQTAIGNFTVPTSAKKGLTTMRIVYSQTTSLSTVTACGKYAQGETQDYPVNILPFGKPTVDGRLTVCEHDSVVMNAYSTADTPVVFTWTGPGGFTGVGPKITFVDADPSISGTYYVTATSKGITSSSRAVIVTVYPKPPIPNVLNANMCQYDPSGKLVTDGKNVLWYNVPVGGFGDTTAPSVPTHTPNTATFYLTQTVNGCVSDRGKVVVNVNLKPPAPIVKSPITYCQLQTPELVAKGENLKWYLDSAGGVASTISPIPPTGFPDSIDYYVSQTINGCESDRARIRVKVYDQPNGLILHTKPYVCQYDTATFYYFGNAPLSDDYKWFSTDGVLVSGGGQGPVVFRFNSDGDKVVNLYVNNGKCATFKLTDTITVRTAPVTEIDTISNICQGDPVVLTIDSGTANIERYDWNFDGGILTSETQNGGPYWLYWNQPGEKTIRLVVWHRTCPSLEIQQKVTVRPLPYAKITTVAKVTDYGKDTTVFYSKLCTKDTMVFTAYKDPSYKYKWYPEVYFTRDTVPVVADRIERAGWIRLDVTDEFGCRKSDSVYINTEPCCEMTFPTAFTPNGDGRNDRFRPMRDGKQTILTFRVANRWGQIVFETVHPDTEGWDGTFGGAVQDMGVYEYFIKYRCSDGQIYEKKGDVTLIR